MNLFGSNPQERAMASLVHDTNSGLDRLNQRNLQLDKWLKDNKKALAESGINTSIPYVLSEYIRSIQKELSDSIDLYYERFSKDFQQQEEEILTRDPKLTTEEALKKEIKWLQHKKKIAYQSLSKLCDWYRNKYAEIKNLTHNPHQ